MTVNQQPATPIIDKSAAIRIATALGWEPKREWIGLTEDEFNTITNTMTVSIWDVARAVEAKLKEKNS